MTAHRTRPPHTPAPTPRAAGPRTAAPGGRELLRAEGLCKRFPGVAALDGVDFAVTSGEVHVLLGENGAGKSTLIKTLCGVHRPDAGRILLDGRPVRLHDAHDAQRRGIAAIHQELNLVPRLTVAENVLLGRQPRRLGLVDRPRMRREAAEVLARVGVTASPDTPVAELGIAQRQLVEIAKALSLRARVLIMDEPTAVLTAAEAERLFTLVRTLRADGVGVVFITHHLEEIPALGDRVTVLRDGRSVGTVPADTPPAELVRLMVGRSIDQQYPRRPTPPRPDAEVLLRVSCLSRAGDFTGVDLTVRAGEVVGLAGLVGAGRTEVARAVFGVDRYDTGTVEVCGRRLPGGDVRAAMAAGLGLVPEDRKGQGLLPDASVQDNLGLVTLRAATRAGLVDRAAQRRAAARMARDLALRMTGLDQPVRTLSGGNQQKVVIGRWLLADSRVLILDEPTRGVDVGAKVEIYRLVNRLTEAGRGVLLISSDLPEVLGISDRIVVMAQGRVTGELPARQATQDAVMALAVGTPAGTAASAPGTGDASGPGARAGVGDAGPPPARHGPHPAEPTAARKAARKAEQHDEHGEARHGR